MELTNELETPFQLMVFSMLTQTFSAIKSIFTTLACRVTMLDECATPYHLFKGGVKDDYAVFTVDVNRINTSQQFEKPLHYKTESLGSNIYL